MGNTFQVGHATAKDVDEPIASVQERAQTSSCPCQLLGHFRLTVHSPPAEAPAAARGSAGRAMGIFTHDRCQQQDETSLQVKREGQQ